MYCFFLFLTKSNELLSKTECSSKKKSCQKTTKTFFFSRKNIIEIIILSKKDLNDVYVWFISHLRCDKTKNL